MGERTLFFFENQHDFLLPVPQYDIHGRASPVARPFSIALPLGPAAACLATGPRGLPRPNWDRRPLPPSDLGLRCAALPNAPQAIVVYGAALAARGRLAVAELGARWGTWGLRAAVAARAYNPSVSGVDLFFAESNAEACRAIEEVRLCGLMQRRSCCKG